MSRSSRQKPTRIPGFVFLPERFPAIKVGANVYWLPGGREVRVAEPAQAATWVAK